jgi:opacity protein-like surface antigen
VVRLILAVLAALCAVPAMAQDQPKTKLYVSADIGSAKIGVSQYAYGIAVAPRDAKSQVFRVRVGYQFIRFFALEAGFADLGSYGTGVHMDCSISPQVQCIPDFESEIDMQAWTINGVGMIPIGNRLTVRAQIGWLGRTKKTHQVPSTGADYTRSSGQVLPTYGVGASFAVKPKLEVFAEWNKFVGDDPGYGDGTPAPPGSILDEADAEAFSLGVRWRF